MALLFILILILLLFFYLVTMYFCLRYIGKRNNWKMDKFDIWLSIISPLLIIVLNVLLKVWDSNSITYLIDVVVFDILIFACTMFLLWLNHKE